jgi:iron complex outermembrane receptor protein
MSVVAILAAALSFSQLSGEVIIVTGDRDGEARGGTALPVHVIDGDPVDLLAQHHPVELMNQAPGVNLQRGNGAEHLTSIRSPVLTGGAGAGAFLYLEDGIALRAAGFSNVNGLFEALPEFAQRIEIVSGPGSALYGSNAMHGLINVLSPVAETDQTRLDLELGSFGRSRGQMRWDRGDGEVQSTLGLSVRHEEGWRCEAGLDRTGLQLSVQGQARHFDWRFTTALVSLNQETAGFVRGPDAYRDLALARSNDNPEAFRDALALRSALHLDGSLDANWSWRLIPYLRDNEMDFLMHFVPSQALEESGHSSVGLLASVTRTDEAGRLTLGVDMDQTRGELRETQSRPTIFSFVQGDHYDYRVDAQVVAAYAQGRWAVGERVSFEAGARYERTRYSYDNRLADNSVGRFLRLADRRDEFETLTPNIGLVADLSRGQIYARLARGTRAPQTTELYRLQTGQIIDEIEPEILDSAELGYRRSWDGVGRFKIAVYSMVKRNVFFRDADGINVTDGRTLHEGVELFVERALSDDFQLVISGSWARHRYDFERVVGSASETITRGDDMDTAPRWTGSVTLNWQPASAIEVSLDWAAMGEYYTDAANEHRYPGHGVFGLAARYSVTDQVEIYTAIRNLADVRYAERADYAFGSERYFPGEERGVSVGVRIQG